MKIRFAKELLNKFEFSSYEDFETYPNSVFVCDKCGDKIGFAFKDLEKHRFSTYSNLTGDDKIVADRLILTMIPKYKIDQKRQIGILTHGDRLIVKIQRFFLRILGVKGEFLPIPKTNEVVPDSFIDYYCPQCKAPIRIYYSSYCGGRHCETGFEIKYILN
jgi:hypothetical protein